MRAEHEKFKKRVRIRQLVTVPLAILDIAVTVVILIGSQSWGIVLIGLGLHCVLGGASFVGWPDSDRGRPDTTLELACIVGSETLAWGDVDVAGKHLVRVIGTPVESTSAELVHGYRKFGADHGCHPDPARSSDFAATRQ